MNKKKLESSKEKQIDIAKKFHIFKELIDHFSKQKKVDSSKKKM